MRPLFRHHKAMYAGAAAAATAAVTAGTVLSGGSAAAAAHKKTPPPPLPAKKIEKVLQADGTTTHGVLGVELNRTDVHAVGGTPTTPFKDGFQLQHEIFFQSLAPHKAIVNGDFSLKPNEIQPVIDSFLAHHIVFQAEHQHLYNIHPMMWFVHFRAVGAPVALARRVEAAIKQTSTPQPQSSPSNPTTPLPAKRLAHILGGDYEIGDNGVVTVTVDRKRGVQLGGVHVKPDLNVSTNVQFQPDSENGNAAVVPDMSMTAHEIMPVVRTLRAHGWESGCLYNQETDEHPQLYFDHFFKVGDAVTLAKQIRKALNHTAAQR